MIFAFKEETIASTSVLELFSDHAQQCGAKQCAGYVEFESTTHTQLDIVWGGIQLAQQINFLQKEKKLSGFGLH